MVNEVIVYVYQMNKNEEYEQRNSKQGLISQLMSENQDLSDQIAKEEKQYFKEAQIIKKEIERIDKINIMDKNNFTCKEESLLTKIKAQEEQISASNQIMKTLPSNSTIQRNKILKIKLNELCDEIDSDKKVYHDIEINNQKLQNEIKEINDIKNVLPSNDRNIYDIARRQIRLSVFSDVSQTEIELEQAIANNEEIEQQIKIAQLISEGLDKENNQLKERTKSCRTQINGLKKDISQLQKGNTDYSSDLFISKSDFKESLKKMEIDKKNRIKQIKKKMSTKIRRVNEENYNLKNEYEQKCTEIDSLSSKIEELTTEILKDNEKTMLDY